MIINPEVNVNLLVERETWTRVVEQRHPPLMWQIPAETLPKDCGDVCTVMKDEQGVSWLILNPDIGVVDAEKFCEKAGIDNLGDQCAARIQRTMPGAYTHSTDILKKYRFNLSGKVEVPVNTNGGVGIIEVDPGKFVAAMADSIVERGPERDITGEEMVLGIFAVVVTIGVVGTILIKESSKIKAPKRFRGHPQSIKTKDGSL